MFKRILLCATAAFVADAAAAVALMFSDPAMPAAGFVPADRMSDVSVSETVELRNGAHFEVHSVHAEYHGKGDRALSLECELVLPEGRAVVFTSPDRARSLRERDGLAVPAVRQIAAGSGLLPRWPLMAAAAGGSTHAIGIAPGSAAVYGLVADPKRRSLRLSFALGFAPERREADVRFAVFSFDGAAQHGFRGAWKAWMDAFPENFTSRCGSHGTWMVHRRIGDMPGWKDFGFRYKEGFNDAEWDAAHGVAALHYVSAGSWNMRFVVNPRDDVGGAGLEDAIAEAEAQIARGVRGAQGWHASRMIGENGRPAGRPFNTGWGKGWSWSMNDAPGISGKQTDYNIRAGDEIFAKWHDSSPGRETLAGEYCDSTGMGMTTELDYDRSHFSAMRTPLTFATNTLRTAIYKGMVGFEFLESLATRLHARNRILMANEAPKNWCWVAPLCDVLGTEANWMKGGVWRPHSRAEMILRRAQCGTKPFCIVQNTDYAAFAPYVERYFQRCLAYGFMPGFFSPKSANDDSHYFAHPEFYERDRPLFRKYIPLCRMLSEAGWRPVNTLCPALHAGDVSAEQFGDRYVALFNHSTSVTAVVKVPQSHELVTGMDASGSLSIPPEACRVLDFAFGRQETPSLP